MISTLTALMIVFAAVIGSTAMTGIILYLLRRIGRLENQLREGAGLPALTETVEHLREDLSRVEEGVAALTERADFTDRLLLGDGAERSTGDSVQ